MSQRVTKSGKDSQGNITKLCWSSGSVSKADAISAIERDDKAYYVEEQSPKVYVHVYTSGGVKHLRTTADKNSKNNLDNLPDC